MLLQCFRIFLPCATEPHKLSLFHGEKMIFNAIESINIPSVFYSVSRSVFDIPFYLKLEHFNLAGSIKFKTATYLIQSLEQQGKLSAGKSTVIESSSGNLGIALSLICKTKGYSFICITDPNTSSHHSKLLHLYGAEVMCVTERDESGGFLGTRLQLIDTLLQQNPSFVWTNQYANPDNIKAHYETTAQEIANEFPHIDYLFIGAGTTGTAMGCAHYFRRFRPKTKIIAVDVEGSVTFNRPPKKRHIPGLGTSKRPPIADETMFDDVVIISEKETVHACQRLLEKTGLLLGGSTGSVISGLSKYKKNITPDSLIVAISPDMGERYIDTVYNKSWVQERL